MARKMTDPANYTAIANAIRTKGNTTAQLKPGEMAAAITALPANNAGALCVSASASGLTDIDDTVLGAVPRDPWGRYEKMRDGAFYQGSFNSFSSSQFSSIGSNAFASNTSVTSISLPNATTMYYRPFGGCSALKTVSLPSIASVGALAFNGCSSLETFIVGTNTATVATLQGELGCRAGVNIYVPDALVSSYKTATNWAAYAANIRGISEL